MPKQGPSRGGWWSPKLLGVYESGVEYVAFSNGMVIPSLQFFSVLSSAGVIYFFGLVSFGLGPAVSTNQVGR